MTENCRFSEKAGFWQLATDTDVLKVNLELFGVTAFGYGHENLFGHVRPVKPVIIGFGGQ